MFWKCVIISREIDELLEIIQIRIQKVLTPLCNLRILKYATHKKKVAIHGNE